MELFQDLKRYLHQGESNKDKRIKDLFPVRSASKLLSGAVPKSFVDTLQSLIKPAALFDGVYFPVIEKFAEFVQNIPEIGCSFVGQEVEFLNQGLERTARALSLCLVYFFPKETNFPELSKQTALWLYATFTASLLMNIGKLATQYKITLYHKKSYPLDGWDPFSGTMLGRADFYKFAYSKELTHFRQEIGLLLARQLLDSIVTPLSEPSGFNLIASDPFVLEAWLSLLSGEADRIPMTSFMAIVPRAELAIMESHRKHKKITLTDPAGEAFLNWLRKEIREARLEANQDARFQVTEKEVILSRQLFEAFANVSSSYKHPEIIEKQFLNIAKLYSIPISELDQRYRALGGISGIHDLGNRYRAVGGISVVSENERAMKGLFLKGGVGLFALLVSQPAQKLAGINFLERKIIRPHFP